MKYKTAVDMFHDLGVIGGMKNPYYNSKDYNNYHKVIEIGNPAHFQELNDRQIFCDMKFITEDVVRDYYSDGSVEIVVYDITLPDRSETYTVAFSGPYDSWSGVNYWNPPAFVKPVQKTYTFWEKI